MAAGCVIGVDLGGTKLLAGTVDRSSRCITAPIAWRARTTPASCSTSSWRRCRRPARRRRRGRRGRARDPVPDRPAHRRRPGLATTCRCTASRCATCWPSGSACPVAVDNDGNAAMLAEWRCGAARGARHAMMLTLGTGIGGGLIVDGRLVRGADGAGGRARPHRRRRRRAAVPGELPEPRLPGGARVRPRDRRARACGCAREAPDSALGRALDAGREITGALVTELAHDGDPAARDVIALIGRRLGVGIVTLVNIFNPEVVVIGGGAIAAGELLLAPAREVVARARAAGQPRRRAARAGALRRRVRDARRGVHGARRAGGGRRPVPGMTAWRRAADRLPDADRQPRGRHAARALGAARGRRHRVRGHAARRRCCSTATGCRRERVRYDEHNERRGRRELVERMRGGRGGRAGQRRRDAAGERSGARARAGVRGGRARGRGAARAERGAGRARGVGDGAATWRFVGFLPRKKGALATVFASPEDVVAFESPRRVAASLAVLAGSIRRGRWRSAAS